MMDRATAAAAAAAAAATTTTSLLLLLLLLLLLSLFRLLFNFAFSDNRIRLFAAELHK